MVLKLLFRFVIVFFSFENSVKMYGTQTSVPQDVYLDLFENSVKMYGTQTMTNPVLYPISV